ncbi:(R)-mandelonitrile lyase-like [Selaginella moellendorffii]|uniref:(R)-mandelonitrile lyase-like n=1 Tax=Selaginella moellendorffii TaxID=88036 RepID=UPI000D1C466B|nr:(R)-mandelonitrile lyase-like [Selaginella moellendorffii]|eukprot:XP_024536201.1 (R)-mandelonitrile lyase-like [Selaginella moellendorffii]
MHEATDSKFHPQLYDYIVVGGGTAGCPLAATLSQKFRVLLLERGGSPYGNPNVTLRDNFIVNYLNQGSDTPVQGFVSTEGVPNARARVLGGGTSINIGFYNRASPQVISDLGLDGSLANASFRWVEQVVTSVPRLGPYQAAFRRSLIKAGVTPDNGASYDFQVGTQTGGTIFDDQGTRRPASNLLVYANPRNLDILLHAQVELILFSGSGDFLLAGDRSYGVKYSDPLGRTRTTLLKNLQGEVILCAGTLGSPQLLLLSGVGPANQLFSPSPVESALAQVVGITAPFGNFIEAACGVAVTGVPGARAGNIIEKVAGPLSSGTLVLQSKNVRDNPLVTFNYFQDPRDLQTCIAGVNTIEEVILANSFRPFVYDNQTLPSGGTVGAPNRRNPAFAATINTTIANYCRERLTTIWHYHGGCLVNQVVDSDYRVLGIKGLRVVDGSTFKYSPGTIPQATILMLGR